LVMYKFTNLRKTKIKKLWYFYSQRNGIHVILELDKKKLK